MSRRPAEPAPAPMEASCHQFDDCFRTGNEYASAHGSRTGRLTGSI